MFKSQLQELCQKRCWKMPEYTTVRDGLDHTPRFAATVIVNDLHFNTPQGQCCSSKEAQNLAAQLAFTHFTSPQPSPPQPPPQPQPPLSGITPTEHPPEENLGKSSGIKEIPLSREEAKKPKDLLPMYKNRLQQYAQKHGLNLPAYSYEFDGPPHSRRFKAKVTIGDKKFGTLEFFPTLKEAENAAAKVALESLSHDDTEEADEALFKTLLQQLAQKEGLLFPSYATIKSGPPHTPTFMSTVEIGGNIFQGEEGKTKKQAEMRAAKIAYNELIGRKSAQFPPSGHHMEGASEFTSPNIEPVICNGLQQEFSNTHPGKEEAAHSEDVNMSEVEVIVHMQDPLPDSTDTAPSSLQLKSPNENDNDSDSLMEVNGHLQDPLPDNNNTAPSSLQLKSPNNNDNDPLVASNDPKPAGAGQETVLISTRSAGEAIPDGATMLPFSNDKWVAFTVRR